MRISGFQKNLYFAKISMHVENNGMSTMFNIFLIFSYIFLYFFYIICLTILQDQTPIKKAANGGAL